MEEQFSTVAADETQESSANKSRRKINRFAPKRIAKIAVFAALAFVVSLLEFPIFSAVPFLKLDFGNAFILLAAFIFGPVEGFVVCFVKELLRVLIYSHTFGVGELANFLITSAFILIPSIVYQFKKGIPTVVATLVIACFVQIVAALLTNRFINFPMYGAAAGFDGVTMFRDVFWLLVAFNAIKSVSVSLICMLLYKKLKYVLDKI